MNHPPGRKTSLVIVEDAPDTRDAIAQLIAFEPDMEVIGLASNGKEAISIVSRVRPDVVLMDLHMPVMDGLTATEMITRMPRWDAAVVMIGLENREYFLRRAAEAGADEYLVKPFATAELFDVIR